MSNYINARPLSLPGRVPAASNYSKQKEAGRSRDRTAHAVSSETCLLRAQPADRMHRVVLLACGAAAAAAGAAATAGRASQAPRSSRPAGSVSLPLRPTAPFRGWAFGTNLTNLELYPRGTINFVPTGPPVESHNTPCGAKCFAQQGVALLGWSYFWYPASDAEKANRTAWVNAYTQQLDPLRHGDQLPGLDLEAGVGMDECAGSQNSSVIEIATQGWRAARRAWPDNFVGAWWAGGCPDDMFIELMLDGTFDLAMIEGYAYCPGCGDWPASGECCANSGVATGNKTQTQQDYYHKLDTAREHGFLNRTVFTLGWIIGKSERNPGGWTVSSLREAMVDLKTKYPEMPGVIM